MAVTGNPDWFNSAEQWAAAPHKGFTTEPKPYYLAHPTGIDFSQAEFQSNFVCQWVNVCHWTWLLIGDIENSCRKEAEIEREEEFCGRNRKCNNSGGKRYAGEFCSLRGVERNSWLVTLREVFWGICSLQCGKLTTFKPQREEPSILPKASKFNVLFCDLFTC